MVKRPATVTEFPVPARAEDFPIVTHTISPELRILLTMARKSQAFDTLVYLRNALASVKNEIQALQKSSAKNQSMVLNQRLGAAAEIERTIAAVFDSMRGLT